MLNRTFESLFEEKQRYNEFISEDKETEIVNAMESAFGSTLLKVNPLLKPLAKQVTTNYISLKLNKEIKSFIIQFHTSFNDKKSLEISSNEANLIIDKYASIIYEEKLKHKKQLEEEQRQKEEDFNNFFEM